jgi:hypothetical protein
LFSFFDQWRLFALARAAAASQQATAAEPIDFLYFVHLQLHTIFFIQETILCIRAAAASSAQEIASKKLIGC